MRRSARDELEQRRPERIDVAPKIRPDVASGLLGGHVRGRPDDRARLGEPHVALRGHAEIDELGPEPLGLAPLPRISGDARDGGRRPVGVAALANEEDV